MKESSTATHSLKQGLAHHQAGRLPAAGARYLQALRDHPDHPDALHLLGVLVHQIGQHDDAKILIGRAIERNPESWAYHRNLGAVLQALGEPLAAIDACRRAVGLAPDRVEAQQSMARACAEAGRLAEATEHHRRALTLAPEDRALRRGLAALLERRGDIPGAIAVYREALTHGVADIDADYHLAALEAAPVPPATPPQYLIKLFDRYAEQFDQHLVALKYRAPELLVQAVSAHAAAGGRDIGDLGCGTGLCGPLFRPLARSLVGVDLSGGMLAKARDRGVYDELVEGELVQFLEQRRGAFDLLISADVLVYIGDLTPVLAGARSALRPGGMLAFSVEAAAGEAFELRKSRRYAHSATYLRRLADAQGFDAAAIEDVVLRQEGGEDMAGHIALFTRRD